MALMAENAQDYRERGLAVFPVGRNKHPLVAWKPYQEELPHPDEVIAWWDRWPDANIGVATGKVSDLVVLDADGPEGIVSLKALNTVATTWLSKTARGYHQFFRHPGRPTPNRAGIRPGLDVRGDGGYAILPPSLHASGSRYEWRTAPRDLPLAPLPDDLLVLLTEPTAHVPVVAGAKTIPEGQRNDHLYRVARALLAKALGAPAVLAALLEENRTRCVPPLPDADVREIAEHAATQAHRFDFRLTGAGAEAAQVSPGLVAGPYSVDEAGSAARSLLGTAPSPNRSATSRPASLRSWCSMTVRRPHAHS